MPKSISADLCIIGAGSGGLSVAAGAAQLGKKVVLIEKGEMGGDCLNYGCVPSKALLSAGAAAQNIRTAEKYGVHAGEPQIDYAAAMAHVRNAIDTIAPHDSQERFEGLGCTVIREHARFTGPRQVKAGDTLIDAKFIIVATGSSPFAPPIPGLSDVNYMTNEVLFDNREKPEHLIVIGGGPIGLEMAQAHRRLGCEVTVLEAAPSIMGNDDPELVDVVRQNLIAEGITLLESAMASKVTQNGAGITVSIDGASQASVSGSHLLVAAGRRANMAELDLEMAGVETNKFGIIVDDYMQTSNKRVYAIGDVAGGLQFTHVAGYHAGLIIRNLLFKLSKGKNNANNISPWVTYTDPELAHIGMTEAKAREVHGDSITVQRWTFDENDRAIAEGSKAGLVKVIANKKGFVLGASMVGKNAGDLIQPWAFAVANKQKIRSFTNYIAPYPTRGEASKRVAGAFFTEALFADRSKSVVKLLSLFD